MVHEPAADHACCATSPQLTYRDVDTGTLSVPGTWASLSQSFTRPTRQVYIACWNNYLIRNRLFFIKWFLLKRFVFWSVEWIKCIVTESSAEYCSLWGQLGGRLSRQLLVMADGRASVVRVTASQSDPIRSSLIIYPHVLHTAAVVATLSVTLMQMCMNWQRQNLGRDVTMP